MLLLPSVCFFILLLAFGISTNIVSSNYMVLIYSSSEHDRMGISFLKYSFLVLVNEKSFEVIDLFMKKPTHKKQ